VNTRPKVLVLGDDTRSFLATVRSLARSGIEVHAAPFDFRSAALKSRYIAKVHWLPYYIHDGEEWCEAIRDLLQSERFELVIPCDERTLLPLRLHSDEFSALSRLAIPDDLALEIFFDKHKTRELARSLGVPVPAGRLITETDTAAGLIAEAGLPMAVKPSQSYVAQRLYSRHKVEIAETQDVLAKVLSHISHGSYFFEAFFEGQGVGLSVLASRGRVLQGFEHHRVHEAGGSSYYRVSAPQTPALADAVSKMVAAIDYTGIAMFEFRVNRKDASWVLLEVNARPWGSLPLPVALGVDFPHRWYKLLVHGEETEPRPYPVGVYGRNFLPDIEQTASRMRRLRHRPMELLKVGGGAVAEFGRALVGREKSDVLVLDDPTPGLLEIKDFVASSACRVVSILPGAEARRRKLDRHVLRNTIRRRKRGGVTINVVCQGNICRSPYAAMLLRRALQSEFHRVRVFSAGMLPRWGVSSPENAIEAASASGIDLREHRSQHLSRELAESATVLVIFDDINRERLLDRYPELSSRLVMLGSFASQRKWPLHIADPDGGDLMKFEMTYAHIEDAAKGMAQAIRDTLDA